MKKISLLEIKIFNQERTLNAKLAKLEKQMSFTENKFKCDQGKFATNSEPGLKSHISKKHKKEEEVDKYIYPKQCDLGDFICNNSKELRKHMRTHSYQYATYKCAMCEFVGGEEIDMEVHNAKKHSDKFECGHCEFEGKDFETLDIHLTTCECSQCGLCEEKFKQVSNVKEHFGTKHK